MSHWEHSRFRIFNQGQHPLRHSASELSYAPGVAAPGVTDVESALNYLFAVIYPNYIGTYDTVGDLPVSSTANDYALVSDDGDGKAAGYVWVAVDGAAGWKKRYDVDWSMDSILSETVAKTQALYLFKYGSSDRDASGTTLTGDNAGQHLYGGDAASSHLTFHANSGDASGRSGFIQMDDDVRPTIDGTLALGTISRRWSVGHFNDLQIATLTSSGTLTVGGNVSATGAVTGSNLSGTNTGDVTLAAIGSVPNANGASLTGQQLTLQPADASFGGVVTTGLQTFAGDKTFSGATSVASLGVVGAATVGSTLGVTGNITGANLSGTNSGDVTLGAIGGTPNANGASLSGQVLTLQPASASFGGIVTTGAQTLTGAKTFDTAAVFSAASTALSITNDATIGGNLTLTGNLITGANTFIGSELQALRSANYRDAGRTSPAQSGDGLFFNGTIWLASAPDTEITHSSLTGLTTGDSGHTQFAMLAGRSGGQTLQGDTASGGHLVLDSTAHATKGLIKASSDLVPTTNASFSVSWSGTDLGGASNYFRDIYSKGVHVGLRLENYTVGTLPSAAASAQGRLVYATDDKQVYVDAAGSWVKVGVRRFMSDTSWNGTDVTKTVTVSSTITDARMAIWSLHDNAADYERILCSIKAISATQVTIATETALPSGSYRLLGLE